jgi:hypothetical protein
MTSCYWNNTGKYQKAYDHFWKILIPKSGNAETPYGEVLRLISKIYYRYYNDGDVYNHCVKEMGLNILNVKDGDDDLTKLILTIDDDLSYSYRYEMELDNAADKIIRYIMLKYSTDDKIWNPETNRLICIYTPTGRECLEKLNCSLTYKIN